MSNLEIVAHRAFPGMHARLEELARQRAPLLRRLGYATTTPEQLIWIDEDTLVEITERVDAKGAPVHRHPDLQAMDWDYDDISENIADAESLMKAMTA